MFLSSFVISILLVQGTLSYPLFDKVNHAFGTVKTGLSHAVGNAHGLVGGAKSKVQSAAGTAFEMQTNLVGSGLKTGSKTIATGFSFISNGFGKLDNVADLASKSSATAGSELQNKWKHFAEAGLKKLNPDKDSEDSTDSDKKPAESQTAAEPQAAAAQPQAAAAEPQAADEAAQ